jgi:hypothetical protein
MPWERPKTTKLYLQPPACDRLITLWPDLKVVDQAATAPPGETQDSFGVHLLFGPEARALPWEETRFRVRGDGIPVHWLRATCEDFHIEVEAFSAWPCGGEQIAQLALSLQESGARGELSPRGTVTHLKITVTNEAAGTSEFRLGIMPRTAEAHLLWGMRPDFYTSYRPQPATWDWVRNTWTLSPPPLLPGEGVGGEAPSPPPLPPAHAPWAGEGAGGETPRGALRDGDRFLHFHAPEEAVATWRERPVVGYAAHYFLDLSLPVGPLESKVFYLALARGEGAPAGPAEHAAGLRDTVARWQEVLAAVRVRPAGSDGEVREMYWSLVAQCLQMLALDHDGLLRPRQGGGCPHVWPWEAVEFLVALDRVGLGRWARLAYQFFRQHQMEEGEDRGRYAAVGAPNWVAHTGAVLGGMGYRLVVEDCPEYFATWRDSLLLAVDWVEAQRARTKTPERALGWGLLPAGTGHDWGISAQYWTFSDAVTYQGLREIAAAFAHFGDPQAERLQAAAEDYAQCLRETLAQVCAGQEDRDELYIPNQLGLEESYPPEGPYFVDGPVGLMRAGILDPRGEIFERVEKYFRNRGWMHNGLTGLMTDGLLSSGLMSDPWAGHTWYVSTSDLCWFCAWLARGERIKAARTLRAQFLYAMTPEYQMQERYADNDPTFCPWQPNASANGRTIRMILDFYGEEPV